MALHIVVDGYNLIRRSPSLGAAERAGLERGREALLQRLAAYRRLKPHRITVVFDGGAAPPDAPERDRVEGIVVLYSRGGESADRLIRRLAEAEGAGVLVVSSDREVMRAAEAAGGAAIDSEAFEARIALAAALEGAEGAEAGETERRLSTRKKGAGRRLPRRMRRARGRAAKL